MLSINSKKVKQCIKNYYIGKLILKEKDVYPSYGIFNNKTEFTRFCDIEELLYKSYYKDEIVFIRFKVDNKTLFLKVGKLYKSPKYGVYEWFVGDDDDNDNNDEGYNTGRCLGDVLFDSVGKDVCFEIGVVDI